MKNLWIDDIRPAPDGWLWAKTSQEAISEIDANDTFDMISFDHDLGGDDTSRAVVLWLCEHEGKWPVSAKVHSMNPIGAEWLNGMIDRYGVDCRLLRR